MKRRLADRAAGAASALSGRTRWTARRLPDLWYPRLWAAWAASSAATFAILETNALTVEPRCPRDTLTKNLQWLCCRTRARRRLTMAGWAAFSVWFLDHVWLSYKEDADG